MNQAIELTDDMIVSRGVSLFGLFRVAVIYLAVLFFFGGLLVYGSHWVVLWSGQAKQWGITKYSQAISAITRTEIVREYISVHDVPLPELISRTSREHKLNPVVLEAILLKESSGGNEKFVYRFEPKVFADRASVDSRYGDSERRARASSHGITQVMGYRAEPDCGVHWSKLYDNSIALNCSATILRKNLASVKGDAASRLWTAYRMYNGSGSDAEKYANEAMANVGKLLFNQIKEGL